MTPESLSREPSPAPHEVRYLPDTRYFFFREAFPCIIQCEMNYILLLSYQNEFEKHLLQPLAVTFPNFCSI